MEQVLKRFNINEEQFLEIKESVTSFMKKYFNKELDINSLKYFDYYSELDSECGEYLQFGADKCSVNNFDEFCEELNIDIKENLIRIIKEQKRYIENINNEKTNQYKPTYVFYSRDKKITFTCFNPGNYMHYFGITGEYNNSCPPNLLGNNRLASFQTNPEAKLSFVLESYIEKIP